MAGVAREAGEGPTLTLRKLLPDGLPTTVDDFVDGLGLAERATSGSHSRPYVVLNMVSTIDGRATLGGRSGQIGGEADGKLFHGLRTVVDGVMVGAGTLRAERYRRLVRDERGVRARRERGLQEQPLACVVSGRLALDSEIPLLADPASRVAVLTSSEASLPLECRAEIEYVRAACDGHLDLGGALGELRARFAVETLLCEGGPHLNSKLLEEGLVDELFLSLSPTLVGGDTTGESLRIVSGPELDPPAGLELVGALEHESHLFLRYRVAGTQ
jgi:riboflavin biosynthesis pyrimidine reductase